MSLRPWPSNTPFAGADPILVTGNGSYPKGYAVTDADRARDVLYEVTFAVPIDAARHGDLCLAEITPAETGLDAGMRKRVAERLTAEITRLRD